MPTQYKIKPGDHLTGIADGLLGIPSDGTSSRKDSRRCRDTFASLKKTCRKLGISFWTYLKDRLLGTKQIPPLSDLIEARAFAP